jgi:cell division protein FtsI (penicillin-binding protein 3)
MLIAQFYQIQMIQGKKWELQARKQHFFAIKEPFKRGSFISNPYIKKGHPPYFQRFVIDVPKFHLYADPESIPSEYKDEVADELEARLVLPVSEKLLLRSQLHRISRSRKLARWLDEETHRSLMEWWRGYARSRKIPRNALFFVQDYQRSYPFGKLLGQVLHTIQNQKEEKTDQAVPTGGLELSLNSYLQGRNGKRLLMRSPRNALETGQVITYPEHGADIYLTVNPGLQAIAEEEIEKGVKRSKGKTGWAVMMDPFTGEILALAQYPFFYPPDYQQYFNNSELIEQTKVKALTDANEPGSTFKPFTMAIALKANQELEARGEKALFSPEEKIPSSSGKFPGRSKPITDTRRHNFLNLDMAMQKSSNIYMARIAERIINRLGNEWFRAQLQEFGFGLKTNIELPAESAGIVPTPGKRHPNGALEWAISTPFSISFGHNIQVTTLQLLRAYAVLANGGVLVQPTLVRCIVKSDRQGHQSVLLDHTSDGRKKEFPRILDKELADRIVRSMRYVTKLGGTGVKADIPGYTEAGKSSTPKKIVNGAYSEKLYCPTFAGFTPAVSPALVLAVTIDEPEYGYTPGLGKNHHGGNCTALVFREIGRRSLEFLGIPPDDPHGYPYGDPRRDPKKETWMDETRKLQEIYNNWNSVPQEK